MNSRKGWIPALAACLMAGLIAMPVLGDTLILRNGRTFSGNLVSANQNSITFRGRDGRTTRYFVRDVDSVHFGDIYRPNNSSYSQPGYDRPPFDQSADQRRPDYNYPPSGGRRYDQAYMERVVVPAGAEVHVRTNERID